MGKIKILNRAKSFYSDEYFISQDIKFELEMMYLRVNGVWRECEESTRSINFEDMLDTQGNKIFASLDKEKGKGGDICIYNDYPAKYTMIFNPKVGVKASNLINQDDMGYILNPRLTVVGIQK